MNADLQAVQLHVARVSHHIDGKRWSELRALFADDVESDYTSLFGGKPQHQTGEELVDGWKKLVGALTTQHLLGAITAAVAEEHATAECHVRACHWVHGKEWIVYGHYVFNLARRADGWLITRLKLDTYHEEGDRQLVAGS